MFLSCGLSNYYISFFHLFNHAFFKALLFLGAGSVIHALFDEQDMRKMGGLSFLLPFTYICIVIGSLAIMGFPFLTGFYSKDLLIELAFSRYLIDGFFVYYLSIFTAFLTSVYSVKLIFVIFYSKVNLYKSFFVSHECSLEMFISLFCLSIFSIYIGYICSDLYSGFGSPFFMTSIFVLPEHFNVIEIEFLPVSIKLLPLLVTLIGSFLTILFFNLQIKNKIV